MQSTANLLNYKLGTERLNIIIEPNQGLFSLHFFTNYWQIADAVVLLRIDLINRLFFIELQSFERMRRQSASSLNRGSVEKQKFVLLDPGILSNRDFVVQTMLLSPVYSQIPIICQLFNTSIILIYQLDNDESCCPSVKQFVDGTQSWVFQNVERSLGKPNKGASDVNSNMACPILSKNPPSLPSEMYIYDDKEQKNINLTSADLTFNDTNWHNAKQNLKQSLKGRQVVSYTENNVKIKTYSIVRDDCENMGRAYVNDISQFLDLANKENVRIVGGKTLI